MAEPDKVPSGFWAWLVALLRELKPAATETTRRGKWTLLHFVEISEAKVRLANANATAQELANLEKAIVLMQQLNDIGQPAWISQDGRLHLGAAPPTRQLALKPSEEEGAIEVDRVEIEIGSLMSDRCTSTTSESSSIKNQAHCREAQLGQHRPDDQL